MTRTILLILVATLGLASCGGWRDSRLNPGNWFGRSKQVEAADPAATNPLLPRRGVTGRPEKPDAHVAIQTITDLVVERTNDGAIIRATGVASRQGAYAPRLFTLKEEEERNGVLEFRFEVIYPVNPRPVGPEQTRRIIVARSVTNQDLRDIRTIRVIAGSNARETRRR